MKSVISIRASIAKIIIVGISLSFAMTAMAELNEKAMAELSEKARAELNEKARAEIPDLKKSASKGNTKDQVKLAKYYYSGMGVQKDYAQAWLWFNKAAESGNAEAIFYMGEMINKGLGVGLGVPQNPGYAAVFYTTAADQGYAEAENAITVSGLEFEAGKAYYFSADSWLDYKKAFTWMQKAADKGNDWAYEYLGAMYQEGKGVTKSDTKAFAAYLKVATNKEYDDIGKLRVGEMYYSGQGVAQDYTKAFEWLVKSAANKNAIAQARVGEMYYQGRGTTKDYTKAFEAYHIATHTILESARNSAIYGDAEDKKAYKNQSAIAHTNYEDSYAKLSKVGSADYQKDSHLELRAKAVEWFKEVCSAGNQKSCDIYDALNK
ncbi:sel1 repeat family protein [Psychrobacter sp. 16-Bac2893]